MKRNYNYPKNTLGSKIAREIRTECNTLSTKKRQQLLKRGLELINGSKNKSKNI
jgi:hypothetical protein